MHLSKINLFSLYQLDAIAKRDEIDWNWKEASQQFLTSQNIQENHVNEIYLGFTAS